MLAAIFNFLAIALVLYDTLGHIAIYSNKQSEAQKVDYNRLIHTWTFYFSLQTISCCLGLSGGEGFLSNIIGLLFAVALLLISLPITGVAKTLSKAFIEDALLLKLFKQLKAIIATKMNIQSQ